MNLLTSSIIIALIYLIAFLGTHYYFIYFVNKNMSECSLATQCGLQFSTVFIITMLLGILEMDILLCTANH